MNQVRTKYSQAGICRVVTWLVHYGQTGMQSAAKLLDDTFFCVENPVEKRHKG
jgi:hypothetical protein